jgi:D-arabinose 1-dehydrogenase-like Zn-dependent alcohol dehydrogenase
MTWDTTSRTSGKSRLGSCCIFGEANYRLPYGDRQWLLNAPWEIREVPTPEPGPNQVLAKIHSCGICGTDVWMTTGKVQFRQPPLAPGHEGVGEIVAVGEYVTMRKVGDRVGVCTLQATRGHCDWCKRGKPQNFVYAAKCKSPVLTGFNVGVCRRHRAAAGRAGL